MPLNWFLETLKWRSAIKNFEKLSWIKSILSIGMGIFLSLVTPNRMGELAGRLIYISKGKRTKIMYCNILCSMAQLQITLLMGLIAALFFTSYLQPWIKISEELSIALIVVLIILSTGIYFSSSRLAKIIEFFSKKISKEEEIKDLNIKKKTRAKLLAYSLLRFVVFTIQFSMLLMIFEEQISFIEAFLFVALLFFVMAVVPSTWLTDLPIRTSLSFFMFEQLGYNGTHAIAATFIIWCLNLIIPSTLGFIMLPKIKWLNWIKKGLI